MPAEEEEVALVVEGDDLAALEFGEWGEAGLEHAADAETEAGDEAVQDELGVVGCGACMSLGTVSTS